MSNLPKPSGLLARTLGNPLTHFTDEELDTYQRRGFVVRSHQFRRAEVARLQQAVDTVADEACAAVDAGRTYFLDGKRFVDTDRYTVQFDFPLHVDKARVIEPVDRLHPELDKLVDDPRLIAPMQSILNRQDLALWTAKLNMKSGGGAGFGWHQDSPYWIHDSNHVDQLPNVMLLLDDQTEENGCFRLIPGSHQQGILPGTSDGSQLGGFYTDTTSFCARDAYLCELPAGSLVFFNPHTVHGSEPNQSTQQRRALIYTYQPAGYPTLKKGYLRNVS